MYLLNQREDAFICYFPLFLALNFLALEIQHRCENQEKDKQKHEDDNYVWGLVMNQYI